MPACLRALQAPNRCVLMRSIPFFFVYRWTVIDPLPEREDQQSGVGGGRKMLSGTGKPLRMRLSPCTYPLLDPVMAVKLVLGMFWRSHTLADTGSSVVLSIISGGK